MLVLVLNSGMQAILEPCQWFYAEQNFWDGLLYSDFRALFAPDVVERFVARDLSWVKEYF